MALNARIKALNLKLAQLGYEPITVSFFHQNSMRVKDFNARFIDSHEVAYNEIIHDFTYHIYSILLTENLLKPLELRYKIFRDFENFSRTSAESKALFIEHPQLDLIFRFVHKLFGVEIDFISGGINGRIRKLNDSDSWNGYKKIVDSGIIANKLYFNKPLLASQIPEYYLKHLFTYNRFSYSELYDKLYNLFNQSDRSILDQFYKNGMKSIEPALKILFDNFVNHRKKELISYPGILTELDNKENSKSFISDTQDIEGQISLRLKQLQKAANLK